MTLAGERLTADIVNGVIVDGDQAIRINSEIRRLMRQMGVKAAAENKPTGPTLQQYLADKHGPGSAESGDEARAE